MTVPEIIEKLGGPTKFGRIVGRNPSTCSEMKRSGSIPVKYWPAIVGASGGTITNDMLVNAHVLQESNAPALTIAGAAP